MIIALDLSLNRTGVALSGKDDPIIQTGVVEPKGLKGMARIRHTHDALMSFVEAQAAFEPIEQVLIEDYAIRGGENIPVVEMGAVIRFGLFQRGIPYTVVNNTKIKQFVTGVHNAKKPFVCEAIKVRFGMDFIKMWAGHDHPKKPKPRPPAWGTRDGHWRNDEADAFVMALIGAMLYRGQHPLIQTPSSYELGVLEALKIDPTGELLMENLVHKLETTEA